jgi:hypothetical protein
MEAIQSENSKLKEDLQNEKKLNAFFRTLFMPPDLRAYYQQQYSNTSGRCDRELENLSPPTYCTPPPNSGFNTPNSKDYVSPDSVATSAKPSEADQGYLCQKNQALEFIIMQYLLGNNLRSGFAG